MGKGKLLICMGMSKEGGVGEVRGLVKIKVRV